MGKPIYILGTGLSHDGSSCLMKDGKIIVAIEKERLTRQKHDGFNDNATISYCMDAAGITFRDISLIVEKNTVNTAHDWQDVEKRSGRNIPDSVPRITLSHHIAHAYSAIGTSPFLDLGVIVMDGRGASLDNCTDNPEHGLPDDLREIKDADKCHYFEKESYYVFEHGRLTPVFKDYSRYKVWDRDEYAIAPNDMEHSIAELYGGASYYVFGRDFSEGKLMGLAPYGRPGVFTDDLFILRDNRAYIDYDAVKRVDPTRSGRHVPFWSDFQYFADLAYWVQREVEKAIKYLFNCYHRLSPQENVAYAGGLALNAVCNGQLASDVGFRNFYFQPAAGDNGLAIGCCYYGWIEVLKREKVQHNGSTFFGQTYPDTDIETALRKHEHAIVFRKSSDYIEETACMLVDGKVVAWYQGESEFGPRSLGHRSILADPRIDTMRDYINREIKLREEFRPFAPSVPSDDLDKYFDLDYETSPYMILVGQTKDAWRDVIRSVVHVDGSARVQTIHEDWCKQYYDLVRRFGELTGVSVLLNTSFNKRGMPIIETPEEAVAFFVESKIDVLVLHDYIVTHADR